MKNINCVVKIPAGIRIVDSHNYPCQPRSRHWSIPVKFTAPTEPEFLHRSTGSNVSRGGGSASTSSIPAPLCMKPRSYRQCLQHFCDPRFTTQMSGLPWLFNAAIPCPLEDRRCFPSRQPRQTHRTLLSLFLTTLARVVRSVHGVQTATTGVRTSAAVFHLMPAGLAEVTTYRADHAKAVARLAKAVWRPARTACLLAQDQ
jgi:hypothetical protein